jgi:hypothetical protein
MKPLKAGLISLAVGVIAGVGMHYLGGVVVEWAALLAVPVTALTLVGLRSPRGAEAVWMPLPETYEGATEHQAAALASRLAESAAVPERFATRVQPRIRKLALAKLRRAGIEELADPRAPSVLGPQIHKLATDPLATLPAPGVAAALFAELEES